VGRIGVASLLALAISGLVFWMLRSEAPGERASSAAGELSLAPSASTEHVAPRTDDALAVERLSGAPPLADRVPEPTPLPAAPTGIASISGTCRAAEDRTPLGGVSVRARTAHDVLFRAAATSDAAGRFELALPRKLLDRKLSIVLEGEGRISAARSVDGLAEGAHLELGELELLRGARCFGRVVDPEGEPVVGAEVRYGDPVTTDAEGRFRCIPGFANGTYQVPIVATGFRDAVFSLELPLEEEPVLTLARAPSIEGYALDEFRRPIEGVQVRAIGQRPCCEVPSDARGRFAIYDARGVGAPVSLLVMDELTERWESRELVPWGTRDLVLSLQRRFAFELEVVDRATGEPVERFAVIQLARTQRPEKVNLQQAGLHAGGKLRVFPVPRGERRLWVIPEDPRWMPHEREDFVLQPDQELALRVGLERRPEIAFLVQDATGAPIANANVELLRSPLDRELRLGDLTVIDPTGLLRSKNGECCLLDHGQCDEQGRLVLHGVVDRAQLAPPSGGITPRVHPPLFARARAEGHAPALVRVPFDATSEVGGSPISLVLSAGAVLAGEVGPPSLLENSRILLHLTTTANAAEPSLGRLRAPSLTVDRSGRFRFDSLASGDVELRVTIDGLSSPSPVGRAALREGETNTVILDLAPLWPARLSVQVQGASELRWIEFWTRDGTEAPRRVPVGGLAELDPEGELRELRDLRVLPGSYDLVLRGEERPDRQATAKLVLGSVQVAPGETYALRYELHRRPLLLRFRASDGSPLPAETKIVLREGPLARELYVDARGEVRCDPGPRVPFAVLVNGASYPGAGLFAPPAGSAGWELEIEFAAR
jgi:hypothetical protein